MAPSPDAESLAKRFDLAQLRHELHYAGVNALPDWDGYEYWLWYQDIVAEAIEIKKALQPKPVVKPGHVDIDTLKEHTDIISVMETYGIKLKKAGRNFKACCPFHKEKTPSFVVYPQEKRYYCFGCQSTGDVFGFIMKMENLTFPEAIARVGEF
jgi:hypothetical protein